MNRLLLTLSALVLIFASCKKATDQVSAEDDLRSGSWHLSSEKITKKDPLTGGDSTTSYQQVVPPCVFDNVLKFETNYIGHIDFGSIHCTASEPGTREFTWQISGNDTRLSMYNVADFFPTNDVDATILTRTLGYLTIRYMVVTPHPDTRNNDTVYYTDVLIKS